MGTKTISIHKQTVEIPAPYEAGHTLNENEARVLNQVRAENIANNFRSKIKDALDGAEGSASLDEVLADLRAYAESYEFTAATSGSGRAVLDPVEREARKLARKYINNKLAEEGRKVKDVEKEEYEAELVRIAAHPQIVKLAAEAVKKLDKLDLSME